MGHAPLSPQTPRGLDFNTQTVCSENQWHFEKSPDRLARTTDQRDVSLIVEHGFY